MAGDGAEEAAETETEEASEAYRRAALDGANPDPGKALNNLGLGFVFTARDLASGAIGNLERNFMSLDRRVGLGTENIQSAFQQLGVGLAVFSAGAVAGRSGGIAEPAGFSRLVKASGFGRVAMSSTRCM